MKFPDFFNLLIYRIHREWHSHWLLCDQNKKNEKQKRCHCSRAFADGSGYKKLYEILTKKGYQVTVVQNPLTSLEDDVNATVRALDRQDGPTVLVGHSWGGTVITEAGTHPKVAALVYIAAFQPDKGETSLQGIHHWRQRLNSAFCFLMKKVLFILKNLNFMRASRQI